jgi:hypothetical protein
MTFLHALRQSKQVARFVLAWFVLSMAVAVAAPVVQPNSSVLVCSASGAVKLVDAGSENGVTAAHHTLDCVLCLALNAPPALAADFAVLLSAPSAPKAQPELSPLVFRSDATLAARAPPALI